MIGNIVTRDLKKEEWPMMRERMLERIMKTFGTSPVELAPIKNEFEEICRYEKHGLTHIKIRYHVFADEWAYAIIILPDGFKEGDVAPAVVTIHGTNGVIGKEGVCDPEGTPRRAYATELAKRGFVTISPDQYGFGEAMESEEEQKKFDEFYDRYPEWSLSCRRVLGHVRVLDVLDQLDYVKHDGYAVMGNSLGGQAAFYLAALDERIKAAVLSTGLSPNLTNIYRALNRTQQLEPAVINAMRRRGQTPWELNEMLALCAPRAVLCIEPLNDPCNPYTEATIDCIKSAWDVYSLVGAPSKLAMYIHGDGHDTVDDVRNFAYDWIERFM